MVVECPMIPVEKIILVVAVLLLLAILGSKASSRLGVPGLLLFLALGMLAGSEGLGGIPFDNARQAQALGVVALSFILFAGGLETRFDDIRSVVWKAFGLSTLGVLITALLAGWFARVVLSLPWAEAFLLGAIVSSTDAAAVFSILRSKSISLRGRVKPLLELESGSNDPMAVFLTLGFIKLATDPAATPFDLVPMFFLQMSIGAAAGLAAGKGGVALINRLRLETAGLYPVFSIALVLFTYGATALLKGNGFLAVYLAGILIGNSDFVHRRALMTFHDGIAWLMQIAMFLTLGLLVFPSRLLPVAGAGLLLALFLMFVARPVAVFLGLLFHRMRFRQKVLVSWVGLRGAAPIILATFPLLAGVRDADLYFNLVFFIVLTSVLLQGTTIPFVARKLGLEAPLRLRREYPLEFLPVRKTTSDMIEVAVARGSPAAGKQIVELGLPKSALIVLVARGEDFIAPNGGTVLNAGDTMLVLMEKGDIPAVRALFESPVE
jgi:cell volume regulation protein A